VVALCSINQDWENDGVIIGVALLYFERFSHEQPHQYCIHLTLVEPFDNSLHDVRGVTRSVWSPLIPTSE
jgi:hypothetical protein